MTTMPDRNTTRTTLHVRVGEGERLRQVARDRLQAAERGERLEDADPVLNFESFADFARLMSEVNLQLLRAIAQDEPESIRQAAAIVDRDYKEVHRNLTELEALGVIEFVQEGRSKRPVVPFDEIEVELSMSDEGDRSVPA